MEVFLIDDEQPILNVLANALKVNGFSPRKFNNPRDAVSAFRSSKCDLVVTDFIMPEMDGIEVLRAVKEINQKAYVIMISGAMEDHCIATATDLGAFSFFSKPLDIKEFMDTLSTIREINQASK